MAARGGSHGAQQSRGGGASRPRVAAEAWEGRSTRELGFEFVDLVIVVVCTDLKKLEGVETNFYRKIYKKPVIHWISMYIKTKFKT